MQFKHCEGLGADAANVYEGRPWAPSPPKHQASTKPGTTETTLANMELGLLSDYEGRLWAPSPKHQASNKPGTPETTLADMVLGLTWIASRCCLIFLRMQCRPVETRPNVVPRKAALKILVGTRAKTILGSYTAAQVRSSECEPNAGRGPRTNSAHCLMPR